jgi:hypothetical protein
MRNRLMDDQDITTSANSNWVDCRYLNSVSFQLITTLPTTAKNFADADVTVGTELIAITAHGFITGTLVALTNSGGALPTGLSATNYYVIKISADSLKLAATKADALAGTAVDITAAAGGGTHTLTPSSTIANASAQIQASNDQSNAVAVGSSQNLTAAGSLLFEDADVSYRWVRLAITSTGGSFTSDLIAAGSEQRGG